MERNSFWWYENKGFLCYIVLFCETSGWKSRDSVPKLVKDTIDGTLKLDSFVSHKMPFEQINDAFELLHAGKW